MKQRRNESDGRKESDQGYEKGKLALLSLQQRVCHSPVICILIACLPQINSITDLSLDNGLWPEINAGLLISRSAVDNTDET